MAGGAFPSGLLPAAVGGASFLPAFPAAGGASFPGVAAVSGWERKAWKALRNSDIGETRHHSWLSTLDIQETNKFAFNTLSYGLLWLLLSLFKYFKIKL